MKLSIIIPLYNSGKFLSKCLDSLIHQDIATKDYEILIINDGSTDNSLNISSEYAEKHTNIFIHSKVNGGVGSARNKGLSLAKGEYIYFIDPDDYLSSNVLKTLLETAKSNTLDILTFESEPTTETSLLYASTETDNLKLSPITNGIDYIAKNRYQNEVWWYFIKKTFIEETKIRFIEGRWMEDAIITAQLFLKAKRMANLPIDAHRYLQVDGSAMTNKEPSHYLKIIDDNRNAAIIFESLIEDLKLRKANPDSIKRIRIRQQSFVFFMMVRMLKSTISLNEVKTVINEVSKTNAYPLDAFLSNDYKGISYALLVNLFNKKSLYFLLFKIFNPILK
jgi:glycosyltransferase involved in cell wall biosynthesis